MRVVFDANILASARYKPSGVPGQLLLLAHEGRFELILSEYILAETARTLRTPFFMRRLGQDEGLIDRFMSELRLGFHPLVEPSEGRWLPADPGDDPIVGTALAAGAAYLVTGDTKHAGNISINFVIERSGRVSDPKVLYNTLPDCYAARCIRDSSRTLRFPKPENGIVIVVYPIRLAPG